MKGFIIKFCFFIVLPLSFIFISFKEPNHQIGIVQPRQGIVPKVAQHPASPIAIQTVGNLDVTQKYFWQKAAIEVKNISPIVVTKVQVRLSFIGPEYTQVVFFESESPIPPQQSATLKCTLFPTHNQKVQEEFERAGKAYFAVNLVEFHDFTWFQEKYWRPAGFFHLIDKKMVVDEDLENEMLKKMGVPRNWQISDKYKLFLAETDRS